MAGLYGNPGEKYGQLTIIEEAARYRAPSGEVKRRVVCLCDCGNTVVVHVGSLRSRNTISCGCSRRERSTTHGLHGSPTYQSWRGMCRRCTEPHYPGYHNYGGRGITVCQRWLDSLEAFVEDMGECLDGLTIERIDNGGNYEPGNCRWASRADQSRNTRRNHQLTYNSETLCIAEWADRLDIPHWVIRYRIKSGWTVADALTTPSKHKAALTMADQ